MTGVQGREELHLLKRIYCGRQHGSAGLLQPQQFCRGRVRPGAGVLVDGGHSLLGERGLQKGRITCELFPPKVTHQVTSNPLLYFNELIALCQ